MSRFTLKTAALLLLSAGAAFAHAPDTVHAASAPTTFNFAGHRSGAVSIPKTFTGGRIVANATPRQVQATASGSLANIPAAM